MGDCACIVSCCRLNVHHSFSDIKTQVKGRKHVNITPLARRQQLHVQSSVNVVGCNLTKVKTRPRHSCVFVFPLPVIGHKSTIETVLFNAFKGRK